MRLFRNSPWTSLASQPAYKLQSEVDAGHALIIAHDVLLDTADTRSVEPMADAEKAALGKESFRVCADAGYSNGEQASNCEAKGIFAVRFLAEPDCVIDRHSHWCFENISIFCIGSVI